MKDTVFQQVLKPISKKLMQECIERFQSDFRCSKFKTTEHLHTMIFVHLHEIKSLRTLEVALNGRNLGVKAKINRSTLSDANKTRSVHCFLWILEQLLSLLPRKLRSNVNKVVKILDSTPTILKGLKYDDWAKDYANTHWQGLKLHTEYDLALESPTRVALSHANYNDSSMGQQWPITPDAVYVFDRGYCDFNWWWSIHKKNAYFVSRLKRNTAIIMESQQQITGNGVLEDGMFRFKNRTPRGKKKNLYRENLRRISIQREGKNPLILVTNLHNYPAETIAELYKSRWAVELFFKWVKQNLKIKKFLGKSANAVQIQLVTAIIAYVLVQIFKNASKDKRSLLLVLTWIRHHLFVRKKLFARTGPPTYKFEQSKLANRSVCVYVTV